TRAFGRVNDRTVGCSGQTTTMHMDDFVNEVWTFTGGPPDGNDAVWMKQEAGTDRRCFTQTRLRENVLLQAKVCQPGNGGPAVNVLAGAMQNTLWQYGPPFWVLVTEPSCVNRGTLSVSSGRWMKASCVRDPGGMVGMTNTI